MPTPCVQILVVCQLIFFSVFVSSSVVPINDKNIYLSELNWYIDSENSFAQTNNPGAFLKVGFTGTSLSLILNQTNTPSSVYATLAWSVDDQPFVLTTLPTPNDVAPVASGLSAGNHTFVVYLFNSNQGVDRWKVPLNVFRLNGIQLDDDADTVRPTLLPKRVAVYWDSIGEGVNTLGNNGGDLVNNASPFDSQYAVASALDAELSLIAFGGQGWAVYGGGNVPGIFNPDPSQPRAWNQQDAVHPRDWASANIDYIFCGHGTNAAIGWLAAQREVSPKTVIFLTIPYGGFLRDTITQAYNDYKQKTNDDLTYLIDLGAEAETGLTGCGEATKEAIDCIHPLVWRNGQLGAMLAKAAADSGLL